MNGQNAPKQPSQAYAEWIATAPMDWPEAALDETARATLDIIACMIAGSREEAARRVLAVAGTWGEGASSVIGATVKLSPPWAALVNGTSAHALDFDDNFDPAKTHPTAVLIPAIFAVGEPQGISLSVVLDGYIAGLQVMSVVGQGVNPYHRSRGWHATATLGAVGAAAACARVLQLDAATAQHALNMSTSMAGGFMSQFGTMTKPLHAGLAAMGGVMAATLAQAGVTAGEETFAGPKGMAALMVGPDLEALRADMAGKAEHGQTLTFATENIGEPVALVEYGLKYKRFPNCGSVHRALDCVATLREEFGFKIDEVDQVDVYAPAAHLANLMHHDPKDPMQAKFSMEYCLVVGLMSGTNTLADFKPEAVMRPDVRRHYDLINLHPVDKLESEFDTRVTIRLKDGRELTKTMPMPVGSKANPMDETQFVAKFRSCTQGILSAAHSKEIEDILLTMNKKDRPLAELTGLLAFAA